MPEPIRDFLLTEHARIEASRRGIDLGLVSTILEAPGQRFEVRPGRDVLQDKVNLDDRIYIVRVFVDVDRKPAEVVTVYRSSKVGKYWE